MAPLQKTLSRHAVAPTGQKADFASQKIKRRAGRYESFSLLLASVALLRLYPNPKRALLNFQRQRRFPKIFSELAEENLANSCEAQSPGEFIVSRVEEAYSMRTIKQNRSSGHSLDGRYENAKLLQNPDDGSVGGDFLHTRDFTEWSPPAIRGAYRAESTHSRGAHS